MALPDTAQRKRGRPGSRAMRPRTEHGVLVDTARALRGSTVAHSKSSEEVRKKQERTAATRAKPARPEVKFKFSQEELLAECVQTEKQNTKWILTAQRNAQAANASAKGPGHFLALPIRVTSSRTAPTTVTFSEVESQPPFFRYAPAPPKSARDGPGGRGICAVTGKPAHYRDPVTGAPYFDLEAFRTLRSYSGHATAPQRRL